MRWILPSGFGENTLFLHRRERRVHSKPATLFARFPVDAKMKSSAVEHAGE